MKVCHGAKYTQICTLFIEKQPQQRTTTTEGNTRVRCKVILMK